MSPLLALASLLPLLPAASPATWGDSPPTILLMLDGEPPRGGLDGLQLEELGIEAISFGRYQHPGLAWNPASRPCKLGQVQVTLPGLQMSLDDSPLGSGEVIHAYLPSAGKEPAGLDALLREWRRSVGTDQGLQLWGRGSADGLARADRVMLRDFARAISITYRTDVLGRSVSRGGASHEASSVRRTEDGVHDGPSVLDGSAGTWWSPSEEGPSWLEFRLAEPIRFDRIVLGEALVDANLGGVTRFRVLSRKTPESEWELVHAGARGVGSLLAIDCEREVVARQMRLVIDEASKTPALSRFELYLSPPRVTLDVEGGVSLSPIRVRPSTRPGTRVRYTLDGSEVTVESPLAEGPVVVDRTATLRARAFDGRGASPFVASGSYRVIGEDDWLQPAPPEGPTAPGLHVEVFEGKWTSLEQLAGAAPVTGRRPVAGFAVAHASRKTHVALRYRGFLAVPADGLYTLALASDDGSRLSLHAQVIVDNGGMHGLRRREGKVALRAGLHPLEVAWFNGQGPGALEVRWSGPGVARDELLAGENLRR